MLLPLLVYAGILALSSRPGDSFGDLPGWLSYVGHVVEYAVLGAALRWALEGRRRANLLTIAVGALLAVADEAFQSTVPGRDPSVVDVAIDVPALVVGAVLLQRLSVTAAARDLS